MEDDRLFKRELRKAVDSKCIDSLLSLCNNPSHETAILNFSEYCDDKKLVHYAAKFGSVDLLKVLVGLGANIQDTTGTGKNTLHIACEEGNEDTVDYLLKTVSDSSFKTALTTSCDKKVYRNVFYYAAISGKINIVRCLENDRELDIDEVFPNKSTALFTLVKENQYEAAKLLCQCGADVNLGFQGQHFRPIHYLAERENGTEMLKLLLKYGANVNEYWGNPPYGYQPLFIALKHKCSENAKLLLEEGANVSFKGRVTKLGWIDCFCLAAMNCPSLIQNFLKHGADPNAEYEGKSVLTIAFNAHVKREDLIALIKAGASKGRDGKTAIQCCKSFSQLELFIDAGITVEEIETRHGVSTLLSTLDNDFKIRRTCFSPQLIPKVISKLLLVGANPNLAREGEESPLILTIKNGLLKAADELIQAGANVNHIGVDGNNAAYACCKSGPMANKSSTMKALIEKGLLLNELLPCGDYLFDLIVEAGFDNSVLISMIENGANINLVKDGKNSVLMKCIQQKRYQVCCAMVEGGADVSYINAKGETAFDIFAEMFLETKIVNSKHGESVDKLNVLNAFLATGIDVNKLGVSGICPLIIATWLRCEDTVRLILENGGDVNIMDNYYHTPLTTALEFDLEEIVNILLNAKANVNHKGGEIRLPSIVANEEPSSAKHMRHSSYSESCMQQRSSVPQRSSVFKYGKSILTRIITNMPGLSMDRQEYYVSLLLDFGADPNIEEAGRDSTLMYAVRLESSVLVKTLIEAGADVNHVGRMNLTALHVYFKSYHRKGCKIHEKNIYADKQLILLMLLNKKGSTNAKSLHGDLPIHLAFQIESVDNERHQKDVLLLVNHSTEMNIPDRNGNTPIILASSFGSVAIIRKMIEMGADVNYKGYRGNSALHKHMISERFDREMVSILLKYGARLNIHNNSGETPLIRYLKRRHVEFQDIQFLVECGADLDSNREGCNSALMVAIEQNAFSIVDFLIRKKVNLNHIGQGGKTAFHVALLKGKCRFDVSIEIKLKRIASHQMQQSTQTDTAVNKRKRKHKVQNGKSPFKMRRAGINRMFEHPSGNAARVIHKEARRKIDDNHHAKVVETVESLLNAGTDVNIITENGKSPLYLLLSRHSHQTVQKLLPIIIEKGADPNLGHYPPLEIAVCLRRISVVKFLLNHGAKVDIKNRRNETPLISASRMCFLEQKEKLLEIIETLLREGSSVNVKDEQGNSPLIISITHGCFQANERCDSEVNKLVSLLLKYGTDPNTQENGKDSALILAVENMLPSVVRTLLIYGANIDHIGEQRQSLLQRCLQTKNATGSNFEMLNVLLSNKTFGDEVNVFFPQFLKYVQNVTKPDEILSAWYFRPVSCIPDTEKVDKKLTAKISTMVLSNSYVDPNFTKDQQNSPLIYFCKIECLDAVKLLIQYEADVNHIGEDGKTAVHHVMKISDPYTAVASLDCMLSKQPNLSLKDASGKTALDTAIEYMKDQCYHERNTHLNENERMKLMTLRCLMIRLLEAGATADVAALNSTLIDCAYAGDFNGMKSLIVHGANMHCRDTSGSSILHLCWSYGINEALAFFDWIVGEEFNMSIVNDDGDSILISMLSKSYIYSRDDQHDERDRIATHIANVFAQNEVQFVKNKCKNSPLHLAAKARYAKTIDVLIKFGLDVCDRNESGFTPLHSCLESPAADKTRVPEILTKLLTCSLSKKDLKSLGGGKLLHLASTIVCYSEHDTTDLQTELTEILLNYGADPNDHFGNDVPLIEACRQINIGLTKLLLDSGANVNVENYEGNSILHVLFADHFSVYSSKEKKLQLVKLLLERGINANAVDKFGRSALFLAVQTAPDLNEAIDDLEEILECNYSSKEYYASKEIISELLQNGADVNLQDDSGNTVLTTFCRSGMDAGIGDALIQAEVDLRVCNDTFCIQYAITNRSLQRRKTKWVNFVCMLLETGASPNKFKEISNLVEVTVQGNSRLVEEILKHGGDVNFANKYDTKRTALHYACILKNPQERGVIIRTLVKFGADLNCPSITGEKPLDALMKSMIYDIAEHGIVLLDDPSCLKVEIDLSLFNLFVCGGCDLTPFKDLKNDKHGFHRLIGNTDYKWSRNLIGESMNFTERSRFNFDESVLLTLLKTGLFKTAENLIRSGWEVDSEHWFNTMNISEFDVSIIQICGRNAIPDVRDSKNQFQNFVSNEVIIKGPKPLSILCRKSIRQQLVSASRGAEIETKINILPIPSKMKSFLALRDFLQNKEIIKLGNNHRFAFDSQYASASIYPFTVGRFSGYRGYVNNFGYQ